jgi:hypothetical protein
MRIASSAIRSAPLLFFRCSRAVSRCYLGLFFGRKAIRIRALRETAGENTRLSAGRLLLFPGLPAKNARIAAASSPFAANPLHLQQNGHRPPGPTRRHNRDQRRFTLAANPLQMQPDPSHRRPKAGDR